MFDLQITYFIRMGFRSSVNVNEAGIDAGGSKFEVVTHTWVKKSSSIEFRNNELRYEFRLRGPNIESY